MNREIHFVLNWIHQRASERARVHCCAGSQKHFDWLLSSKSMLRQFFLQCSNVSYHWHIKNDNRNELKRWENSEFPTFSSRLLHWLEQSEQRKKNHGCCCCCCTQLTIDTKTRNKKRHNHIGWLTRSSKRMKSFQVNTGTATQLNCAKKKRQQQLIKYIYISNQESTSLFATRSEHLDLHFMIRGKFAQAAAAAALSPCSFCRGCLSAVRLQFYHLNINIFTATSPKAISRSRSPLFACWMFYILFLILFMFVQKFHPLQMEKHTHRKPRQFSLGRSLALLSAALVYFTSTKLEHLHCLRVFIYIWGIEVARFISLVLSHVYLLVFVAHDFDRANSFCMTANIATQCTVLLNLELNNQHTCKQQRNINNNFMMN